MSAIGNLPRPGTRGSGIPPSIHPEALIKQARTSVAIASPQSFSVAKKRLRGYSYIRRFGWCL